jgi:hypothetical protein
VHGEPLDTPIPTDAPPLCTTSLSAPPQETQAERHLSFRAPSGHHVGSLQKCVGTPQATARHPSLYLCVCLRPIARGLRVAWQVGATVGGKLAARRSATDQCSSAEEAVRVNGVNGASESPMMHSSTP